MHGNDFEGAEAGRKAVQGHAWEKEEVCREIFESRQAFPGDRHVRPDFAEQRPFSAAREMKRCEGRENPGSTIEWEVVQNVIVVAADPDDSDVLQTGREHATLFR